MAENSSNSLSSVDAATEPTEFKRSLSLIDSTLIVSGSMIGSGVFIVTADMARNLGSSGWLLMLWVLTGVLTVAAALSYGELAGMMPKAGGQYIYIQRAFGPLTGFVYGWTVFMVIQTGTIAAVAVAFAKYTAVFIPALGPDNVLLALGPVKVTLGSLFAISSLVLLTWLNSRGVQSGKLIQNVFTSAKLIALLGLIVIGITLGVSSGLLSENLTNAWSASLTSTTGEVIPLAGYGPAAGLWHVDDWVAILSRCLEQRDVYCGRNQESAPEHSPGPVFRNTYRHHDLLFWRMYRISRYCP